MDKQEIIDYLYSFNTHADITIEEMADDLAISPTEPYKGMTKGEVIMAVKGEAKVIDNKGYKLITFTDDWWNSPYEPQESEG
jgi:hypothetical protein